MAALELTRSKGCRLSFQTGPVREIPGEACDRGHVARSKSDEQLKADGRGRWGPIVLEDRWLFPLIAACLRRPSV